MKKTGKDFFIRLCKIISSLQWKALAFANQPNQIFAKADQPSQNGPSHPAWIWHVDHKLTVNMHDIVICWYEYTSCYNVVLVFFDINTGAQNKNYSGWPID